VRTSKTTGGLNYHTVRPHAGGHTPDIVYLLALQTAKPAARSSILGANTAHNIL
jgi:hypothetical protein